MDIYVCCANYGRELTKSIIYCKSTIDVIVTGKDEGKVEA